MPLDIRGFQHAHAQVDHRHGKVGPGDQFHGLLVDLITKPGPAGQFHQPHIGWRIRPSGQRALDVFADGTRVCALVFVVPAGFIAVEILFS